MQPPPPASHNKENAGSRLYEQSKCIDRKKLRGAPSSTDNSLVSHKSTGSVESRLTHSRTRLALKQRNLASLVIEETLKECSFIPNVHTTKSRRRCPHTELYLDYQKREERRRQLLEAERPQQLRRSGNFEEFLERAEHSAVRKQKELARLEAKFTRKIDEVTGQPLFTPLLRSRK